VPLSFELDFTMDLSNFTTEELRQKHRRLDATKSPHEALELSNEIGRRTVDLGKKESFNNYGVKVAKLSPRIAFVSIFLFISDISFGMKKRNGSVPNVVK